MGKARISEWMWRFLALVMLFAVCWSMWIFYQLNAPPLITEDAFRAAAAARANPKQNVEGMIAPATAAQAAALAEPAQEAPQASKEPPINADKLKLSDTLTDTK